MDKNNNICLLLKQFGYGVMDVCPQKKDRMKVLTRRKFGTYN